MKKKNLQDRYLDELLREESQGTKGDEAMVSAVEKAIDDSEVGGEVTTMKAASRAPWAWAAMFVAAGVGGLGYLATNDESKDLVLTTDEALQEGFEKKVAAPITAADIQKQEALVEEKRKALDTIVQAMGVPAVDGTEKEIYQAAERQLYESEREKEQLEIQITKLLELEGDDLMKYAAGLDLPNNAVLTLYAQYKQANRELAALQSSGLGAEHPDIKRREIAVEQISDDLDKAMIGVRGILQTQFDLTESRLGAMAQVVQSRRESSVSKALESHDYIEAKRDYENAQLEMQEMKLAAANGQENMNRFDVVVGGEVIGNSDQPKTETPLDKSIEYGLSEPKTEIAQLGESLAPERKPSGAITRTNTALSTDFMEEVPPTSLAAISAPQAVGGAKVETRFKRRLAVGQNFASPDAAGLFGDQKLPGLSAYRAVPESGSEKYGALTDQGWMSPQVEPLSTFSVDVDTASYANIRRMLNAGQKVPADAVRVEECINYFDYNYAGPQDGKPFATHVDLATCPWDEEHLLLKVGLKGQEVPLHTRPASNLVFLLDVSGSMQNSDKLPLVVESMKILVEELDERDRVSIVVYAGAEGVVLEPTRITDDGRGALLASLNKLRAGGSTNGGAGIKRAYQIAQDQFVKGGVNRVILCSDGDFNVGTTGQEDLVKLVKERAQEGVFLSVLGFGTGNINDSMLEAITNDGNGNYFYIDSIREGRKVFLQDLSGTLVTIAKDVKLQVEFNPSKVANYRLIGYANRRLKKEDFNNDKVDAGDIGAGHTVTALYEIVPLGSASPIWAEVDDLKYQAEEKAPEPVVTARASNEWLNVKLRYKQPDEDVSTKIEVPVEGAPESWKEAGADFQLAASVALFGMKLRNSQYVGGADWELVQTLGQNGQGNDIHGHRAEFLKLVEKVTE